MVVYVTFVRPLRKKKDKDPLERSPGFSSLAQRRAVERDMSNLLVELSDMARQMTAQLDTRAAKLELLLKEADERIASLHSAGGMLANSSARPYASDALEGVIVEAQAPSGDATLPRPQPLDPRHAQVYDLADEGLSPPEIARQLGRPSGEIELILALRADSAT
jgi:DNA-binding NarL/FixJ family response regulator